MFPPLLLLLAAGPGRGPGVMCGELGGAVSWSGGAAPGVGRRPRVNRLWWSPGDRLAGSQLWRGESRLVM